MAMMALVHKRFLSYFAAISTFTVILFGVPLAGHAVAPPVTDPTVALDASAPVLISSLVTTKGATFVELHNQSDTPINLHAWTIRFSSVTSDVDVRLPDGWILADGFVTLSENGSVPGTASFPTLAFGPTETVMNVQLIDPAGAPWSKLSALPADITTKWYQRKSTGISGVFVNDFSVATASTKLRHTPLYHSPISAPSAQIVELYPHATDCAPNNGSPLCHDYVKLFNPTDHPIDLADYRLRSDSSTSESSNAFHLDHYASIPAGGYLLVALRDDGTPMSLTDDGGYVWLEDAEGVVRYDDTIVSYPSASSTTKIGSAWARASDGTWQWTTSPQPNGQNVFPPLVVTPGVGNAGSPLGPCPEGKYRSPDTNRCRAIEEAINELASCPEGQYRNPETNRCRATVTAANATLTPCQDGYERNPDTNRCRKIADDASTLKPCDPGQERNPDTNRCRKVVAPPATTVASTSPTPGQQLQHSLTWWVVGIVGAGAVGVGVFEWRHEILTGLRKLVSFVPGKK